MPQEFFTKEQFWAELDALGEDRVRENIATKRYGSGNHKRELAEEWLRTKEVERATERSRTETAVAQTNLAIAKSSRNAAWVAALAAVIAVVISVIALLRSGG